MDRRCETLPGLEMDASPFSKTPNSLKDASPCMGDGSVEPVTGPLMLTLARRSRFFRVGDPTAEVRLEIRGILVGVSFMLLGKELSNAEGGMSFGSLE